PTARIEVEGLQASDDQARFNIVDNQFFEVFNARFLAGRSFDARDFRPGSTPMIVNRSFVTEIIGGGNALSIRVRIRNTEDPQQMAPAASWHDIVGIVDDFPGDNDGPMMFYPMTTVTHPVSLTIRAPAGVSLAAQRLRTITARVDPQLKVGRVRSLDEMYW